MHSKGGGYDFYLANNCNRNTSSSSNAGHSYMVPKNSSLLAGQPNFMVKDYEVLFLLSFSLTSCLSQNFVFF